LAEIKYCHCSKCNRDLNENQFYTYKDGRKTEMCKKCLTMHVDPFDETTYVWLLEKMDVPFVPVEWNALRDKDFAKNPNTANGTAIFGKYLSKMRLKQFKDFGYADSEEARKMSQKNLGTIPVAPAPIDPEIEAKLKEDLEEGKISEAQYKTLVSTETQHAEAPIFGAPDQAAASTFYDENNFMKAEDLPDPAAGLTEEDKIYLAMKWGRLYKPNEWIELERKYKEMTESFDIQESDTSGTLILICKTYLKMNQAIDCGDMDGFQKLSRVYDSLRKSAKFTAAQNKDKDNNFLTSVGELVNYCEKEGSAIPRYEITEPYDRVDKIIDDLKEYNKSLIYSDTTLSSQIEEYLKQRTILDQKKAERLANGGKDAPITNEDYEQYFDQLNEDLEADQEEYNEQ